MKAHDFSFDGKTLSSMGFILCKFDSSGVETVDGVQITFNTIPTLNGQKHELISTQYEDCLELTIQICKHSCTSDVQEITATDYRNISRWLLRKNFLKFKILDEDHVDLYYEVAFTGINKIEIGGRLIGLELTLITNTPFALKEPKSLTIQARYLYAWERFYATEDRKKGKSTGTYVTSYNRNAYPDNGIDYGGEISNGIYYHEVLKGAYYYVFVDEKKEFDNRHYINDTSHEEGYIYPYTEITITESGNLNIHNAMENRDTYIANCVAGEVITMDYPVITSSIPSHNIQNDFNWNFFRVANTYKNSRNNLTFSIPCTMKIKYSPIIKVGI